MAKQPLSEAEYRRWVSPAKAIKIFDEWGFEIAARAIAARLSNGLIRAAARRVAIKFGSGQRDFWPIQPGAWSRWACLGDTDFWRSGEVTIHEPLITDSEAVAGHYSGVRFHPDYIEALKEEAGFGPQPPEQADSAAVAPLAAPAPSPKSDLSGSDAKRFCRAILEGWPDATQDFAHEKAVLFFHDHRVPRDWFRSILRSIRGTTKPGKKPKSAIEREISA